VWLPAGSSARSGRLLPLRVQPLRRGRDGSFSRHLGYRGSSLRPALLLQAASGGGRDGILLRALVVGQTHRRVVLAGLRDRLAGLQVR
jgi:hypothetical protein